MDPIQSCINKKFAQNIEELIFIKLIIQSYKYLWFIGTLVFFSSLPVVLFCLSKIYYFFFSVIILLLYK